VSCNTPSRACPFVAAARTVNAPGRGDPSAEAAVEASPPLRRSRRLARYRPARSNSNPLPAAIQRAVQSAAPASWAVRVTGIGPWVDTAPPPQGAGVLADTLIGGFGALIVLAFVFASILALVPLLVAGISILVTFLATLMLTQVMSVIQIVVFLIALIGLGSHRLLPADGHPLARGTRTDAVTARPSSRPWRPLAEPWCSPGSPVGIGLLVLEVLPVPYLRSTGVGGVLIPPVSVAVAVTLLPVVLATAGIRWTSWAQPTFRRRGMAAAAGLVVLIALTAPCLGAACR
jgi:putative drug exporter of the RND superfamily